MNDVSKKELDKKIWTIFKQESHKHNHEMDADIYFEELKRYGWLPAGCTVEDVSESIERVFSF